MRRTIVANIEAKVEGRPIPLSSNALTREASVYLAGGFANYINVENAKQIGFLAPVQADRIFKIGNASIDGACELLMSVPKRNYLKKMVDKIEHVELETTEDFFDIFVEGCQFKPMPTLIEHQS